MMCTASTVWLVPSVHLHTCEYHWWLYTGCGLVFTDKAIVGRARVSRVCAKLMCSADGGVVLSCLHSSSRFLTKLSTIPSAFSASSQDARVVSMAERLSATCQFLQRRILANSMRKVGLHVWETEKCVTCKGVKQRKGACVLTCFHVCECYSGFPTTQRGRRVLFATMGFWEG